jgi:hypothetical protein
LAPVAIAATTEPAIAYFDGYLIDNRDREIGSTARFESPACFLAGAVSGLKDGIQFQTGPRTPEMKGYQLLEIRDEWCREMAKQAIHDAKEIDDRIILIRSTWMSRQSPEVAYALGREIAALQRIKEELESDVDHWVG